MPLNHCTACARSFCSGVRGTAAGRPGLAVTVSCCLNQVSCNCCILLPLVLRSAWYLVHRHSMQGMSCPLPVTEWQMPLQQLAQADSTTERCPKRSLAAHGASRSNPPLSTSFQLVSASTDRGHIQYILDFHSNKNGYFVLLAVWRRPHRAAGSSQQFSGSGLCSAQLSSPVHELLCAHNCHHCRQLLGPSGSKDGMAVLAVRLAQAQLL